MAGKYSGGKKENEEVASLRGLHRLKQGMPERPVPVASNKLTGRCDYRPPLNELPGRLPGLSLYTTSIRGLGENVVHNTRRKLPL